MRFGAVMYPTVQFGAVLKIRKSFGAVRCGFQNRKMLRCGSVRLSDIANLAVRFGAVPR